MAIEKKITNREIVFRFDDYGNYLSSDVTKVEVIIEDGVKISSRSLPPEVISQQDADALLTSGNSALTQQLADAVSELAEVKGLVESIQEDKSRAIEGEKSAIAERDAALATVSTLQQQLGLAPTDKNGFAVLSPVQIRLGLLAGGITAAQIDAVIGAIPDATQRESAIYYWEYSREYHRDHALIGQLSAALGLTSEQVDQMWAAAAVL